MSIWEEEELDDLQFQQRHAEREDNRLKEIFMKQGYVVGVEKGRQENVQKGFNVGFRQSAEIHYQIAIIDGFIQTLRPFIPDITPITQISEEIEKIRDLINTDLQAPLTPANTNFQEIPKGDYEIDFFSENKGGCDNCSCSESKNCSSNNANEGNTDNKEEIKELLAKIQGDCKLLIAQNFGEEENSNISDLFLPKNPFVITPSN